MAPQAPHTTDRRRIPARPESTPPPEANPPLRRRGGGIPGPVEALLLGWQWLRRMRTALYLLGLLGVLSIVATLVPQQPNVPATVADWRAGRAGPGRVVARLIDLIGGFDVYGSRLFQVVLVLLFTSLTACLVRRYRAWWRLRRAVPPHVTRLDAQPRYETWHTDVPADEVRAAATELLRRRRFRVRDDGRIAAEKGLMLREGGSLLFHTSFYVLLAAVVAGQLLGFSGQVGVVEGQAFTDTPAAYWTYRPGRLWGADDHRRFRLQLDRFEVDWYPDRLPRVFLSHVRVDTADGRQITDTIGPNDPLVVDGMKIYQLDWGYAPRIVVMVDGEVVHDATIPMPATTTAGVWHGVVKVPATDPDLGLDVLFVADAPEGPDGTPVPTGAPWPEHPLILFDVYRGDLRFDRVQNVNTLDTTAMTRTATRWIRLGEAVDLGDGVVVAFPELRRWVGFQVSNRPTLWWLLAAGGLMLTGLLPALYAHRRRVWVAATPDGPLTRVEVAGRAFQREEAAAGEFRALVALLRQHTGTVSTSAGHEVVHP